MITISEFRAHIFSILRQMTETGTDLKIYTRRRDGSTHVFLISADELPETVKIRKPKSKTDAYNSIDPDTVKESICPSCANIVIGDVCLTPECEYNAQQKEKDLSN